ncbi:MFS transporter [Streptomyces polyrhachis]|uniref:MFS transporter n=1 Tax=Streptomyces polyrhachis TaxID=1282885 RepID=A0ABW2GEX6_9ACTN
MTVSRTDQQISEPSAGEDPSGGRLWSRDFRLFFTARTVARFGDGMVPVALAAGLVVAGYGATSVSLALGLWTACFAGFVLFGGVLADRFSPRRVMIAADLLRAGAAVALAADFAGGTPHLGLVYVLSAVGGVGAALFQPGVASTIPAVASDVQGANAVIRVSEALMTMAGPAAAGLLVGFGGAGTLFSVNAATFVLSAGALFLMRMARPERTHVQSPLADLVEGWREFRSRTWLWGVIAVWTFFGLLAGGPSMPMATVVVTEAHGATVFGVLMGLHGVGEVLGGLVAMRIRPARPLFAGSLALSGFALQLLALGLDAPLWVQGAGYVAGGAGFAFWLVQWFTTVQTQIPHEALTRVHAYDVAGSLTMSSVGQMLAGPVAGLVGARHVLLAGSGVTVAVIGALLAIRPVRRLRAVGSMS